MLYNKLEGDFQGYRVERAQFGGNLDKTFKQNNFFSVFLNSGRWAMDIYKHELEEM